GTKGVFSCYEEAISRSMLPLHGLTTGYTVSPNQSYTCAPYASLAVSFDLAARRALGSIFSLAPYYPEPNTIIRVLDNFDTLEVSFPGISLGADESHAHYESPQEVPLLIKEIIKSRFRGSIVQASYFFRF